MSDIFVSYASSDRDQVEPLVGHLEAAGFSVWWDRQLHGGTMFSKKIEDEVRKAKVVLVIWSPEALESRWVADEAELALQTGKLVPITMGGVQAPMGFRQLQALDFGKGGDVGDAKVKALINAIHHQLSGNDGLLRDDKASGTPDTSIAVLPFVNMSADPEQEYFADGISEELLNLLAKIPRMRVAARTSSFQFKGQNLTVSKVGKELNVAHILEGSVRKAGNRVRITSQLIKAEDGYHLWSETYDRTLDDIFAIQDEISAAIVEALKELVLGDVKAPVVERTDNLEAYELYLLGVQAYAIRTLANCQKAATYMERAIAADPDFGPAYAELGVILLLTSNDVGCVGVTPVAEARAMALPFIERALELAPDHPMSHAAMSTYHRMGRELDKGEEAANKALALNPNLMAAHASLIFLHLFRGSPYERWLDFHRNIVSIDPLNTSALGNLSTHLLEYRMFDEAEEIVDKMSSINPGGISTVFRKTEIEEHKSNLVAALKWPLDHPEVIEEAPVLLVYWPSVYALGLGPLIEHLEARFSTWHYLLLGDLDSARRTAPAILAAPERFSDYRRDLTLSLFDAIEGRPADALTRLTRYDEKDPEKWGEHFNPEEMMVGAQLSAWARLETGDKAGGKFYVQKLNEAYEAHLQDPDGALYFTYKIGASAAMMEGNRDRALDLIEKQVEQSLYGATGIRTMPWFRALNDEPRFKAALGKLDAHIASEKARAEEMGLLPLSPETEAFWRGLTPPEALSLTGAVAGSKKGDASSEG